MWSILTDPLPDVISVNGVTFDVNTDFRVWLRAGQLLSAGGKEIRPEKKDELTRRLFDLIVPADGGPKGYILEADFIDAVSTFYAGPQHDDRDPEAPEPDKPKPRRTFDFDYDAAFVYQSFASFYGIRLCGERMHWWEFLELFNGLMLSEGNSLNFVMGVRQKKLSDIPKNQRAAYGKMKKAFALPKEQSVKQAENAVYDMLEAMWAEADQQPGEDVNERQSDH